MTAYKDYFLDQQGIDSMTSASIQLGTGVKVGQVLAPTEGTELDAHRVQWGAMYHDTAGDIGTANRLHYWYQAWRHKSADASDSDEGVCYAYSDDYGTTWTRPNLGLVSYNGNTNNNILWIQYVNGAWVADGKRLVGVAVRPTESKKFKFVCGKATWPAVNMFIYEASDIYLQSGVTELRNGFFWDHMEAGGTYDGKLFITQQDTSAFRFAVGECLTSIATDPLLVQRGGGNQAVYGGTNCITSAITLVAPETQNHGATFIKDLQDLWGRVAIISPVGCGGNIWWMGEFCTLRKYEGGLIRTASIQRKDSPSAYAVPLGSPYAWGTWPNGVSFTTTGAFDGGSVNFIPGGMITLATGSSRLFYSGFLSTQDEMDDVGFDYRTHDRMGLGAIDFRKDGWTMIGSTGASPIVVTKTVAKPKGATISINHNGSVQVELLDPTSGVVLTGYDKNSCDAISGDTTASEVTWGGGTLDASDLSSFKMKFYL